MFSPIDSAVQNAVDNSATLNALVDLPAEPTQTDRKWSKYQEAIFDFIQCDTGNLIIKAVAGSGKTTTIVEAIRRIPDTDDSIFLAFNKSIAEELKRRGVNARTFHSLTYGPVTRYQAVRSVDADKLSQLISEKFDEQNIAYYGAFMRRMVGLARNAGIGAVVEDIEQAWVDLAEHHDIELQSEYADFGTAIANSRKLLAWSNEDERVDFDDLLYMAVRNGISLPKFDWVFVDEAQDTNVIQRALLRKLVKAGTRIVAVGDPAQAIYGFRGSDSDAMDLIKADFGAVELPLTVSYRCPLAVIAEAQTYVDYIEAAPNAAPGAVTDLGEKWGASTFKPLDMILCRLNAPLISVAYKLITAKVPAFIMGRDFGNSLKSFIGKLNARTIDSLQERIEQVTAREMEKAVAKRQDSKVQMLQDRLDCLVFMIGTLQETDRTVRALLDVIDLLFAEVDKAVKLSTIHKAKGLEADHVYWLNPDAQIRARRDWQQIQERNLGYVAVTRAKQELTYITAPRRK